MLFIGFSEAEIESFFNNGPPLAGQSSTAKVQRQPLPPPKPTAVTASTSVKSLFASISPSPTPPQQAPPVQPPRQSVAVPTNDHSAVKSPEPPLRAPALANVDISAEWEEKYSSQQQKSYWKHKITGEKTWKNPEKISSSAKAALQESKEAIKSTLSEMSSQKNDRFIVYDKMRKMLPVYFRRRVTLVVHVRNVHLVSVF
jgi:hypothetical protein